MCVCVCVIVPLRCDINEALCCNERITYDITGFNGASIKHFIQEFFSANKSVSTHTLSNTDLANQLNDEILKQPILLGLCSIPINLHLLCLYTLRNNKNS